MEIEQIILGLLAAEDNARRQAAPPPGQAGWAAGGLGEAGRRALPPLPLPLPPPLPEPAPLAPPTRGTGHEVRERPYGNGAVLGALMAQTFPLPLPPPSAPRTGPLFNPNAALDPSQIEDRRGASTLVWRGIPQPVAPPFYQPWLLPAYHEALANWERQVRGRYRGPR